jgi:serine/threonine protein phosphatase PrpC
MRALVEAQDASPRRATSQSTTVTAGAVAVGMDSPSAGSHTVDRFVIHSQMRSPDHSLAPSGGSSKGDNADDDADGGEEEVELRELREAVMAAATETALAMSTFESNDVRWQVVRQCQTCNEVQLRKLLEFDPSLATCRANFDKLGPDGYTPLHVAAHFNNIKALRILFEIDGVSAWIRDLQGRTPLHIAAGRGHDEVCAYLRERMANEGGGKRDPVGVDAPVDLAGSTPAGWAAICTKGSVSPKVRATLFQPGDKTILPRTPHTTRAGKSPKRVTAAALTAMSGEADTDEIVFAFSVAQGWKGEMEDKVVVSFPVAGRPAWSLFGVCDGHGGAFCSTYLAANLPRIVATAAAEAPSSGRSSLIDDDDTTPELLEAVLRAACLQADEELRAQPRLRVDIGEASGKIECKDGSGSTGVLCLITRRYIAVGNVGDSRAVLAQHTLQPPTASTLSPPPYTGAGAVSAAGVLHATALSTDHKYSIPSERTRAEAAGAVVAAIENTPTATASKDPSEPPSEPLAEQLPVSYEVFTERFRNGSSRLRMSRSFGDFYLKQTSTLPAEEQAVVAVPEVVIHPRSGADAFVVLACDGVFDVMSNQHVVDTLAAQLGYRAAYGRPVAGTQRCAEACDALLQECLSLGAHDNLSALVVVCPATTAPTALIAPAPATGPAPSSAFVTAPSPTTVPQPLLQSPPFTSKSKLAETPSSGAASRTPIDRTLSRVLYSPADQFFSGNGGTNEDGGGSCGDMGGRGDAPASVNRHLEFGIGAPSPTM